MALYPFHTSELSDLTVVGVTPSVEIVASGVTYQVTVSSIGTNVVIRMEGSLDGTNFFNLDEDELDTTITANGTRGYALSGCPIKYARLRLVSYVGGTPTVSCVVGGL